MGGPSRPIIFYLRFWQNVLFYLVKYNKQRIMDVRSVVRILASILQIISGLTNCIAQLVLVHSSTKEKNPYKENSLGVLLIIGFITGIAALNVGILNLSVTKRANQMAERETIRIMSLNIMCIILLTCGIILAV